MNTTIEDIKQKLETAEESIDKVKLLNELSEEERKLNAEESLRLACEAIELAKKVHFDSGLGKAYLNAGISSRILSNYESAFQYFENALNVYSVLEDPYGKARVLNSLGNTYMGIADYKYCLEYLKQSHEIAETLDDRNFEASVLSNIGLALQEMGNYIESLEYYLRSMQIYSYEDKIPDLLLNNIGIVYQNIGDYEASLDFFFKALTLTEQGENKANKGSTLGNIGIVYTLIKDYESAVKYLSRSLANLQGMGHKSTEINVYINLGSAFSGLGDFKQALSHYFKAISFSREISDKSLMTQALNHVGHVYYKKGEFDAAEKYYKESLQIAKDIVDVVNESVNYMRLGELYFNQGKSKVAENLLYKSLEIAGKRNAYKEMSEIHKILSGGFQKESNYEKAYFHLKESYASEKKLLDLESNRKIRGLATKLQIMNTEHEKKIILQEKEIYKLRNVELADANLKLEKVNEEKNEFLGIVAHDLKNPLSGILNFSRRIRNGYDRLSRDEVCDFARIIENASEKLFLLIQNLLDVNAIESGRRNFQFETFNINPLITEVIEEFTERFETKEISVVFNNKDEDLRVYADKGASRQIFDNLFSNAVKFSPKGKNIFISTAGSGGRTTLRIKDEGPGLTEKDKQKLFTKFSRLSALPTGGENSSGLGLSIVKKLTELMDGKVWCESEKGNGAEFIVELPARKKNL